MKKMFVIRSFIILNFILGCQTAQIKEFDLISLGQDKSDVIDAIGGPSWKDRKQGFDRWTYIVYQDGVRLEREIHFLESIVIYKGEPMAPFITAEEQDDINQEKNLYLDRTERIQRMTATSTGAQ